MFVVALAPCKSYFYFFFIYRVKILVKIVREDCICETVISCIVPLIVQSWSASSHSFIPQSV